MKTSEMKVIAAAVSGLSALGRHVKRQGRSLGKAIDAAKEIRGMLRRLTRLERQLERLKGRKTRGSKRGSKTRGSKRGSKTRGSKRTKRTKRAKRAKPAAAAAAA